MAAPEVVAADPQHYTVEHEDERVRVLRARYGPGERSVMHSHPAHVAVLLSDAHMRFSVPDGTAQEIQGSAGQVLVLPGGDHLPENLGDAPFEGILIELKGS
jgi:quercetin dioxygenase-like cupin family protein